MKRIVAVLAATCATIMALSVTAAAPASATVVAGKRICGSGLTWVRGWGQHRYVIRNDDFGTAGDCISVSGRRFTVTRTWGTGNRFPYIGWGCEWGLCTPHPLMWRWRNAGARVSWYPTGLHAGGAWNASLDTWLDPRNAANDGQEHAEVMVWLHRAGGYGSSAGYHGVVQVDGRRWYLIEHRTGHTFPDGVTRTWPLVMFWAVHPVSHARRMPLVPFYRIAERHGWIGPAWYLTSVDAGFEIYSGGRGLGSKWFSVFTAS